MNSRPQKRLNQIWRRRKCQTCGAIFSTHEQASYEAGWRISVADGTIRPFLKNKLFLSVYKSCEHREQAIEDATALTDTIVGMLSTQAQSGILALNTIARTAHGVLHNFDAVAAVQFKAFHPFK